VLESRSADTIAAIATAAGRGAVGVVRVSGPLSLEIAERVAGAAPAPRRVVLAKFSDAEGAPIDRGLLLAFPAPSSYTGEDVVEFQCHGGPVVLAAMLERCLELGARAARAGEFTERAYLNGKLDLAQAEAVADLIEASSRAAARSALRSLEGDFSRQIEALRERMVALRVLVEAALDFPEEDIDVLSTYRVIEQVAEQRDAVAALIRQAGQGQLLREGVRVVLLGEPNVGKSSLLNALAGDSIAIVSSIAGTTRDLVRTTIMIADVPFHFTDTAGLREAADEVERIGIDRARSSARKADLVVRISEGQGGNAVDGWLANELPEVPWLRVRNKADLRDEPVGWLEKNGQREVVVSAKTGAGLDVLRQALLGSVGSVDQQGEGVFMARSRHIEALVRCRAHLDVAVTLRDQVEFLAEELRYAEARLGDITGSRTADDLLGDIFRSFCIGK
jgi:tRNA modification GTPase